MVGLVQACSLSFKKPDAAEVLDSLKGMRRHIYTHTEVSASYHFKCNGDTIQEARIVVGYIGQGPKVCTRPPKRSQVQL